MWSVAVYQARDGALTLRSNEQFTSRAKAAKALKYIPRIMRIIYDNVNSSYNVTVSEGLR
jgi:hypothetical protein